LIKLHSSAADVEDLIRDLAKELGLTERLSTITLHLVDVDAEGNERSVREKALPPRMTLAAAGLTDNAIVVVKVASGAVPATVSNGESCSAECKLG